MVAVITFLGILLFSFSAVPLIVLVLIALAWLLDPNRPSLQSRKER